MPVKEEKKKIFKRIGCFFVIFAVIVVVAVFLLLVSGSGELEKTEYHPFKSMEAKERWIHNIDEQVKTSWLKDSDSVYVDTNYGKTFVRISGPESSPPLVLLHGAGSNSLMWAGSIRAFSEKYRTYAVDTIDDYGLSINTKLMESADDYTEWLDELFSGLNLGNGINLIGLSYGGWMSGQYALRHQDRLNKVVLIVPAGTVQPIRMQAYVRVIFAALPFKYCKNSIYSWLLEDLKKQDEDLFEYVLHQMAIAQQCFKSSQIRISPGMLSDQELQNLKLPVLFLTGANEKGYSPTKAIERLEKVAPSIQKELIPGAGHDLAFVKNELVNTIILKFLSGTDHSKR